MFELRKRSVAIVDELARLDAWIVPFAELLEGWFDHGPPRGQGSQAADPIAAIAEFTSARKDATLRRYRAGGNVWNDWAEGYLKLGRELHGQPDQLVLLNSVALADFSRVRFADALDMAAWQIPADACFAHVVFEREVWLSGSRFHAGADFVAAQFEGPAYFEGVAIAGRASFASARFAAAAEFRKSAFTAPASFAGCRFEGDAWFRGARFQGSLDFSGAVFEREAGMGDCDYSGLTTFSGSRFAGNAGFDGARFDGPTSFDECVFTGNLWFKAARFAHIPSFELTRFGGALHLEDMILPPISSPVHERIDEIRRRLAAGSQ